MPDFKLVSDFGMTGDQPQAVASLPKEPGLSLEERIKLALSYYGGK
jgi:excinuclease UvrABC helicase subunit UvrB